MFNDLIGLPYKWGAFPGDGSGFTDCFGLSMTIRARLGLHDFRLDYAWLYEHYDETTLSGRQIVKWLWERGEKIPFARPGAVFMNHGGASGVALATVIDPSIAMLIGHSGRAIMAPLATVARGRFYWAE